MTISTTHTQTTYTPEKKKSFMVHSKKKKNPKGKKKVRQRKKKINWYPIYAYIHYI